MKKALKYMKEHKKVRIFSITVISVISLFFIVNFGRYVKDIIVNYITRTQRFYFNSDKLTEDNKEFEIKVHVRKSKRTIVSVYRLISKETEFSQSDLGISLKINYVFEGVIGKSCEIFVKLS